MAFGLFDAVIAFRFGALIDVNDFLVNSKAWFCVKLVCAVWKFQELISQWVGYLIAFEAADCLFRSMAFLATE